MRIVIQRVQHARVTTPQNGDVSGQIGRGLLALVGLQRGDSESTLEWAAQRLTHLRIFPDAAGKMNRSLLDLPNPQALLVPNFTVACDLGKGRRPGFEAAMPPEQAGPMFYLFVEKFAGNGVGIQTGTFGAEMHVTLCNEGPVTFILESASQPP